MQDDFAPKSSISQVGDVGESVWGVIWEGWELQASNAPTEAVMFEAPKRAPW